MSLSDRYIAAQNLVAEGKLLMMQMTIADRRLSEVSSELAKMGLSLKGEPLQAPQFFPPQTPVAVPEVPAKPPEAKASEPKPPENAQNAILSGLSGQAT